MQIHAAPHALARARKTGVLPPCQRKAAAGLRLHIGDDVAQRDIHLVVERVLDHGLRKAARPGQHPHTVVLAARVGIDGIIAHVNRDYGIVDGMARRRAELFKVVRVAVDGIRPFHFGVARAVRARAKDEHAVPALHSGGRALCYRIGAFSVPVQAKNRAVHAAPILIHLPDLQLPPFVRNIHHRAEGAAKTVRIKPQKASGHTGKRGERILHRGALHRCAKRGIAYGSVCARGGDAQPRKGLLRKNCVGNAHIRRAAQIPAGKAGHIAEHTVQAAVVGVPIKIPIGVVRLRRLH